jgi:hypothetical protein
MSRHSDSEVPGADPVDIQVGETPIRKRIGTGVLLVSMLIAVVGVAILGAGVEATGRFLVLAGMLLTFVAQIAGVILLKEKDSLKAILALLMPGYFCFALKREGYYGWVVGSFMLGLAGFVSGTLLLS